MRGKKRKVRERGRRTAADRGGTARKDKSILIKMKCVVTTGPSNSLCCRPLAVRQRFVARTSGNEVLS